MITKGRYGYSVEADSGYEETRERVVAALKEQGFGVLTEIDVKATLKEKLDANFRKYTILGSCNPPLAHRALQEEEQIGLLLPCNVVVYENDAGGTTVAAIDAEVQLGIVGRPELAELARDVSARLGEVLKAAAS
jgi:uncharacterized protein (DUF302 family)